MRWYHGLTRPLCLWARGAFSFCLRKSGERGRRMPRKKAYRIVKGAFVYLYLDLAFFTLSVVLVVRFWEQSLAWFFLAFWAANFAAALWAKRKLILDLLEGRTETFQGQIDHRENAGSLRCVRVEYLVEQGERPRRFILFPDALPLSLDAALGLLSGRTTLRYLPRSLAVVEVIGEVGEGPSAGRRTKEWYKGKARLEEEYRPEQVVDGTYYKYYFRKAR